MHNGITWCRKPFYLHSSSQNHKNNNQKHLWSPLNSSSSYTTKNSLRLLLICTTKVPFYDPSGNIYLYIYIDGISMGSPSDPTISEFYMSRFESKIFKTIIKSKIYVRYVDNIFVTTHSYSEINRFKQTLEKNA